MSCYLLTGMKPVPTCVNGEMYSAKLDVCCLLMGIKPVPTISSLTFSSKEEADDALRQKKQINLFCSVLGFH